jgi:hypothetical protein
VRAARLAADTAAASMTGAALAYGALEAPDIGTALGLIEEHLTQGHGPAELGDLGLERGEAPFGRGHRAPPARLSAQC